MISGDYEKCPICGEYGWSTHICRPAWFVYEEEYSPYDSIHYKQDPKWVYENGAEEAAVKYCESDYEISDELDVWIISQKDYYDVLDDNQAEEDEEKLCKLIVEKSTKFHMCSEITRNFYAYDHMK